MLFFVNSISLEDIYADPHRLDGFLDAGEPVSVVRDGRKVAEVIPPKSSDISSIVAERPRINYRARFLQMWGPDAFRSGVSVAAEFEELRRERTL